MTESTASTPGSAWTASDPIDRASERRIYWIAFVLRFGLGTTAWLLSTVTRVSFLEDASHYEMMGAAVAADWLAGRQSLWLQAAIDSGTQAWVIVAIIAAFYFVLGGIRAVPVLIAIYAAITSYTPVLTYRLTQKFGGNRRAARFAAYLVALSPCFVFWSGSLYKEGLILLMLNLAMWSILVLLDGWRTRSFLVLTGAVGLLFGLRFYIAFLLTLFAAAALLAGRRSTRAVGAWVPTFIRQVTIAVALILVMTMAGVTQRMRAVIPGDWHGITQMIQTSRADLARARSGFLPAVDVSSPAQLVAFVPVGTAYFLTVPLPWQIGSLRQNLTIPETLLWILLYPLMLLGFVRAWRADRRSTLIVIGFTLVMSAFYAVFLGNIGTVYRMRIQVWLFWAIFAGIGWEAWRGPSKRPRPVSGRKAPAV